jgi:hypothetical protein
VNKLSARLAPYLNRSSIPPLSASSSPFHFFFSFLFILFWLWERNKIKSTMDDIAIVGVGLRFPGEAKSPDALWEVLEQGRSQWTEFPKDRLNINGYYHPGGERQGTVRKYSCLHWSKLMAFRFPSRAATFSRTTFPCLTRQ